MIVFSSKLGSLLKEREMLWIDLQRKLRISPTIMAKFQKDRPVNSDTINKVCEYLKVQPGDIMEWIPDAEYEAQNAEKIELERQIAEMQTRLKELNAKKN